MTHVLMVSNQRVVLLVQHHDDSREMYAEFLAYRGFKVLSLADGDGAFDVASQADVIVTSIRLRGITDGITLIERLRDNPKTKQTPIIVLAASVFPDDRARAANAGCNAFLPMPRTPHDLLREVHRLLLHCATGKPVKARHTVRRDERARHRTGRPAR